MPIHAVVKVYSEESTNVRVIYECERCEDSIQLVTPWTATKAGGHTKIYLVRFRAYTTYKVWVTCSSTDDDEDVGTVGSELSMTTGSTGFPNLDGRYAIPMGTFGYDVYVTERAGDGFHGFLGFDSTGYVVWGMNFTQDDYFSTIGDLPSHAIDQYPDYTYVMLLQGSKQMYRMDATGKAIGDAWGPEFKNGCSALTHEAFIDKNINPESDIVLSIQHELVNVSGTTSDYTLAQKLVTWNHATNKMEDLFNILDVLDPVTQSVWEDPLFPGYFGCTQDDGVFDYYSMSDFTHCNSAATGIDGNYILSSRATSTIYSIYADGRGLQWTISSSDDTIESDYSFIKDREKFYNQHFVRQIDNGNIIMIDNGNTRPPSQFSSSSYSRAVEYELTSKNKLELVWEFLPGQFSLEGGSIDLLSNGNRLVTLPYVEMDGAYVSVVYEVDSNGDQVANMTLPWLGNLSMYDTPTRGLALDSVNGESHSSFFISDTRQR